MAKFFTQKALSFLLILFLSTSLSAAPQDRLLRTENVTLTNEAEVSGCEAAIYILGIIALVIGCCAGWGCLNCDSRGRVHNR